ncbi:SDR family oxidoreductase [Mycobacterium avium subsp. hominissuis]|uniref:Short-chain dehydrogenase n=1 Tax=Mycobacterium timonense TaxID=701043 RepID=A0ABX3TLK8_9MYCO|nr:MULTISPECIES: SDR family oxidoreductase [Mycobacterium avium complex (MAC)]PBA15817.1 NAD(P)-dependent oxidoreductase [Mycobacterium avium]MBZ4551885.1 SDR family oxidoreductase [Mycobacterium avium subsp. hominissuis]MBZ4582914.1 SDR family oxidoreductase [Mycobacterium avium subsp. hominissuis]MBZ4596659.1 SDR family oxidoreductase [Mycobacterium avium subsp. hominissuis]MDV3245589.1 SDR family oxidoreductase [Mycobacterium avium subsp. hominissuis]
MVVDKAVLITGAGSGIGASTARALYRRGARLLLVDVDGPAVQALAEEFGPGRSVVAQGDVRDPDAMRTAVDAGIQQFGGVDAVVANAGVGSWTPVLDMQPAQFRHVVDINLVGLFNTVGAALPALVSAKGYVLVVASVASYVAAPGLAAYTASKAGAEQFANALRLEMAWRGVDVGSAHMSWVDTPLFRHAMSGSAGFAATLATLPRPFRRTLSADDCGEKLADAVQRRAARVAMPRWVAMARWAKPLLSTPLLERQLRTRLAQVLEDQG